MIIHKCDRCNIEVADYFNGMHRVPIDIWNIEFDLCDKCYKKYRNAADKFLRKFMKEAKSETGRMDLL